MSEHSYQRILSAFMAKPWAILPEKLEQISGIIALRLDGQKFSAEEIEERINGEVYSAARKKPNQYAGAGVAVIPITGVITPRADMMSEMSGGTSMQTFIKAVNQAAADPNVASILLEVDSPGGQVDMVPEAAAAIRAARAQKPVTAVANTMAASAAYWLASQASEFVISPSAEVGSIGVFAGHNDLSQAMEAQGVKTTLISAGKYKTELSPYQPLSAEAKAAVQQTVDEYYAMFTKDVAAGRRVSVSAVRGGFGEGRMLTADRAVAGNMADRVDTLDNTLRRMVSQAAKNGARAEIETVTSHSEIAAASTNFIGGSQLLLTTGTTTSSAADDAGITYTNLWPTEEVTFENGWTNVKEPEAADSAQAEEFGAESDRSDAGPQESLDDLRRKSRTAAIGEREAYLSLLRRMT